jgi:hypothetical protein
MADAGKYVLLDLFWDERTNDLDKAIPVFTRHKQGEVLDLDEGEATRLLEAGSVEPEGARKHDEFAAARDRFRAALANLPDDLRAAVRGDLEDLVRREVPVEELTVHTAPGLTNPGHPRYAAAAHGEGGVDEPESGQATTEELTDTQAALDDGTGDGGASRRARRSAAAAAERDEKAKD